MFGTSSSEASGYNRRDQHTRRHRNAWAQRHTESLTITFLQSCLIIWIKKKRISIVRNFQCTADDYFAHMRLPEVDREHQFETEFTQNVSNKRFESAFLVVISEDSKLLLSQNTLGELRFSERGVYATIFSTNNLRNILHQVYLRCTSEFNLQN